MSIQNTVGDRGPIAAHLVRDDDLRARLYQQERLVGLRSSYDCFGRFLNIPNDIFL